MIEVNGAEGERDRRETKVKRTSVKKGRNILISEEGKMTAK